MSVLEVYVIAKEPRVNERIRAREVRLVDPEGGQIGIKSIEEARWLADQLGLDLVEVAPDARPPVCRLMDYGKFKYEASVKAREARKKQTRTVIKEVQFRPKIGGNDFEVKRKRAERFLNEGDKVKVTMRFRGREVTHPEIGRAILERLVTSVEGVGVVETFPKLDGKQMTMVLAPVAQPKKAHVEEDDSDQVVALDDESTAAAGEVEDSAGDTPAETESVVDEVSTKDEAVVAVDDESAAAAAEVEDSAGDNPAETESVVDEVSTKDEAVVAVDDESAAAAAEVEDSAGDTPAETESVVDEVSTTDETE